MSYYDYYSSRSSKPSHTGGDAHNGSFEQVSGTHSSPHPHPTQPHPTYVQQQFHAPAQQQTHAGYGQHPNYQSSSYQQTSDPRYQSGSSGQAYNYHRTSPSSNPPDPRRLAPLSLPRDTRDERWQSSSSQYYDLQAQPTTNYMRSSHPEVYSPTPSGYPQAQSLGLTHPHTHTHTHTSPYLPSSSRVPVAAANPHHHQSTMPMSHSGPSVDRTQHMIRSSTQLPYARNAPDLQSPVDFGPPSDLSEPTIKKKRKRADARQLEVLNATYNRTAFPSTEERAALAKQLDMSARSVQIWFQNKRQAMRQGGRATNPVTTPVNPGPVSVPTPTPSAASHRGPSPAMTSRMVQQQPGIPPYTSRSPPPPARTGHTPSPPGGRSRADMMDPRMNWPGTSRRY